MKEQDDAENQIVSLARAAQKAMVEKHGGEEMFVGKPKKFEYSPVPEDLK